MQFTVLNIEFHVNVNTGVNAGAMRKLELHLQRKLVWIVCLLHTNELPLRRLIKELDGPTLSNNKFSGPIDQLLDSATDLEIIKKFPKTLVGPPLITLPDKVIKDLSTDQHYGYRMVSAIRRGNIPGGLALLEIGPVNHTHWLTTANRILKLSVIQTLIWSDDEEERSCGVKKILAIRGEGLENTQKGDSSVRSRRTPEINPKANSIVKLIDWTEEGVSESPLTCSLTTGEIKCFVHTPMKVPDWPCHTQSIERVVKMVTEASGKYFSHEKRDGVIKTQEASRRLMPRNESKQDLVNIANFRK